MIWFAGGFLVFSAISGKQPHYLVPEIPALGLLLAFALLRATAETESCFWRPLDRIIPAGLFFAVAAAIAAAFHFDLKPSWATSAGDAQLWPLAGLVLFIGGFLWRNGGGVFRRVSAMAGLSVAAVIAVHVTFRPMMLESHDFRSFSETLKRYEGDGYAFVTFGKYHGQFHFLGRLTEPFGVVDGPVALDVWLKNHPKALIVALHETLENEKAPVASTRFRGRVIGAWRSDEYPPRVARLKVAD